MAQLMPLPLTVSCFSKIQISFTFLVPDHLGSPGKGPLNGCLCVVIIDPITPCVCCHTTLWSIRRYKLPRLKMRKANWHPRLKLSYKIQPADQAMWNSGGSCTHPQKWSWPNLAHWSRPAMYTNVPNFTRMALFCRSILKGEPPNFTVFFQFRHIF